MYQIIAVEAPLPAYGGAFTSADERTTRLEVHVVDRGQDYDVMGYSADALLHDVLEQFDRHQDYLGRRDLLKEKRDSLREKTDSLKAAAAERMKFLDPER